MTNYQTLFCLSKDEFNKLSRGRTLAPNLESLHVNQLNLNEAEKINIRHDVHGNKPIPANRRRVNELGDIRDAASTNDTAGSGLEESLNAGGRELSAASDGGQAAAANSSISSVPTIAASNADRVLPIVNSSSDSSLSTVDAAGVSNNENGRSQADQVPPGNNSGGSQHEQNPNSNAGRLVISPERQARVIFNADGVEERNNGGINSDSGTAPSQSNIARNGASADSPAENAASAGLPANTSDSGTAPALNVGRELSRIMRLLSSEPAADALQPNPAHLQLEEIRRLSDSPQVELSFSQIPGLMPVVPQPGSSPLRLEEIEGPGYLQQTVENAQPIASLQRERAHTPVSADAQLQQTSGELPGEQRRRRFETSTPSRRDTFESFLSNRMEELGNSLLLDLAAANLSPIRRAEHADNESSQQARPRSMESAILGRDALNPFPSTPPTGTRVLTTTQTPALSQPTLPAPSPRQAVAALSAQSKYPAITYVPTQQHPPVIHSIALDPILQQQLHHLNRPPQFFVDRALHELRNIRPEYLSALHASEQSAPPMTASVTNKSATAASAATAASPVAEPRRSKRTVTRPTTFEAGEVARSPSLKRQKVAPWKTLNDQGQLYVYKKINMDGLNEEQKAKVLRQLRDKSPEIVLQKRNGNTGRNRQAKEAAKRLITSRTNEQRQKERELSKRKKQEHLKHVN